MSGLDPLAALAAQAVANAQASMDEAILSLGVDVAVLQAQVNVGEVIAATVLAPQGGTDLLSFLGQTVTAQIPPGINPGETMLLQVTGFTNSAVIVKNLGTLDPQNPVPTVNVEIPSQPPGAPQSAVLTTTIPVNVPPANPSPPANPLPASSTAPPPPAPATTTTANVAPPREVFVAASVQNAPLERAEQTIAQVVEQVETQALNAGSDVEARLALNRASAPVPPQVPLTPQSAARLAPAPSNPSATASVPTVTRTFPVAPPIVQPAGTAATPVQTQPAQAQAQAQALVAKASPEATLLARLGVPLTPITLAAARTINTAGQSISAAYERLETTLAQVAPEESGALRSMLAFVARFDLRNARALPEQIATYVSDVLDGAETKIMQTVSAWSELELPQLPASQTPPAAVAAEASAQQQPPTGQQAAPAAQQPAAPPAQPVTVNAEAIAAQAAERTAAMDYDVKSAILAMIASPAGNSPAIAGALREALTATTALQLNVLNAQATDPRTITVPLPAYFYDGGQPVTMQISRDAPNGKNKMDADNFHIAFVLDTKSLGTVAIDLQTVGRAVSVDVKTQATSAADRFRATLGDLRSRLEQLRYNVTAIGAGVAPPRGEEAPKTQPLAPAERKSFWDMRA
jgi:hypothetical protein